MPQFHETPMGQRFYGYQVPKILEICEKAVETEKTNQETQKRIAVALEGILEELQFINKWGLRRQ